MELHEAKSIADWFVERIRPACERVEIAGSIRRGKLNVKDIEIVCIVDQTPPRAVFGQKKVFKTQLDAILNTLSEAESIAIVKDGDKYKQLHVFEPDAWNPKIKIDLFIVTPPASWGVLFTIRTGPNSIENDFSRWIVTQRHKRGCLPDGFRVQDGAVWKGEIAEKHPDLSTRIDMPEEIDFLTFLGLGWIEPGNRIARVKR